MLATVFQATLDIAGEAASPAIDLPLAAETAANPVAAFGLFMANIIDEVVVVAALALLLYMIWGAFDWITAGEAGKVSKGRERIQTALIGFLVLFGLFAVFLFIQNFVGVTIIDFSGTSGTGTGPTITGGSGSATPPSTRPTGRGTL